MSKELDIEYIKERASEMNFVVYYHNSKKYRKI